MEKNLNFQKLKQNNQNFENIQKSKKNKIFEIFENRQKNKPRDFIFSVKILEMLENLGIFF